MLTPRDIGLVWWTPNPVAPLAAIRAIGDAPWDSDGRNLFDPRGMLTIGA